MGKLRGTPCRTPLDLTSALAAEADALASAVASPEERVEEALRSLLDGRHYWPTPWELIGSGHGELLREMNRLGGVATWRRRFGMSVKRGNGTPTEAEAELALRHFLEGRDEWPTRQEFTAAALDQAVLLTPGPAGWRDHLGFPRNAKARWTDELIRRELAEFLDGRSEWPSQREFRDTGRKGLLDAIYNHGGAQHWAAQFDLHPRHHGRKNGSAESPTVMPPEVRHRKVEAQLAEYLADKTDWPTKREFYADRRSYLFQLVRRTGGQRYWAPLFGMTPRPQGHQPVRPPA